MNNPAPQGIKLILRKTGEPRTLRFEADGWIVYDDEGPLSVNQAWLREQLAQLPAGGEYEFATADAAAGASVVAHAIAGHTFYFATTCAKWNTREFLLA